MTKQQTLLDLAERCEAATGPDRRLDYEIMVATVPTGHAYMWNPVDQSHRYTSSLDVALTLVPGDCDWLVNSRGNYATAWHAKETGSDSSWESRSASTPALALCAAALRSHAAGEGE